MSQVDNQQQDSTDPASATLFLMHGRGVKPEAARLKELWRQALEHGLARDHKMTLDGVNVELIYYGDLTGPLDPESGRYDPVLDLADRRNAFKQLSSIGSKAFRRARYEAVPGLFSSF